MSPGIRIRWTVAIIGGVTLACATEPQPSSLDDYDDASLEAELLALPATVDESALDRSVSPCDDFFQFACGGYLASVELAGDDDVRSRAFEATQEANSEALASIITGAVQNPVTPEDQRVATLFNSCVAFHGGDRAAPGALMGQLAPELSAIREAKARGLGALLARAQLSTSTVFGPYFHPVFAVSLEPDLKGNPNVIAMQVSLPYPAFLQRDAAALAPVLAALYPASTEEERAQRVASILKIDGALGAIIEAAPEPETYHPIGVAGLKAAMPHIDWDAYLGELGKPRARNVIIYSLKAMTEIDALLAGLSLDELADYLEYKTVFRWLYFERPVAPERVAGKCMGTVASQLAGIIELRFVDTVMGKKNTRVAMAMARRIKTAFEARLDELDFLDAPTRAEAAVKIQEMKITPLEHPRDDYADVTFVADSYLGNLVALSNRFTQKQLAYVDRRPGPSLALANSYYSVNAFYSPAENRFTILPGIAHGTFFGGSSAPAAHNFGALGLIIGHEITHGFDDNGRFFDARGVERDWWTPESLQAFNERGACFTSQYDGFLIEGVIDPDTQQTAHVDGELTLGENIADNGGLRVAYAAATPYFPRGKDVAGFTPEQQFFLAHGQAWCEKRGPAAALDQLKTDVHSPSKARVNMPLANFDRFAQAFSCAPTDKMVASNACVLW